MQYMSLNRKGEDHLLYCSRECAVKDGADPDSIEEISDDEVWEDEKEVCDENGEPVEGEESRFWYCQDEGVTSPTYGAVCSVCDGLMSWYANEGRRIKL